MIKIFCFSSLLLFVSFVFTGNSQQLTVSNTYSDFFFNRKSLNPAYAGDTGIFRVDAFYYKWKEAPGYTKISADGFLKRINSGVGLESIFSQNGLIKTKSFEAFYNYQIDLGTRYAIRAGTSFGLMEWKMDYSNCNDTSVHPKPSMYYPILNFGIGIFLKNHTIGVSYHNFFKDGFSSAAGTNFYVFSNLSVHYSVKIKLNPNFYLQPDVIGILRERTVLKSFDNFEHISENVSKFFYGGLRFGYKQKIFAGGYTNLRSYTAVVSARFIDAIEVGYIFNYYKSFLFNSSVAHGIKVGVILNRLFVR